MIGLVMAIPIAMIVIGKWNLYLYVQNIGW